MNTIVYNSQKKYMYIKQKWHLYKSEN